MFHIDLPNMTGLLVIGANTSLVAKKGTKIFFENAIFDCNFALFRGKIWLWLFYNFFALWFQDSTQKISSHTAQIFFQSSWHDEIICRWRHNPPGGENWKFVLLWLRFLTIYRQNLTMAILYFFAFWFQDSTQKISSYFNQKWRLDGDFFQFFF